MLIYITDCQED